MRLYDRFTILSSGSKHSSSNTLSSRRLSAKKRCRNEPANVVTILFDRLESFLETGVTVPSVAVLEASEGFLAVLDVLADP